MVWALALLLPGCTDEDPKDAGETGVPLDCGEAAVDLGYGKDAFGAAAQDGDVVQFVHGPQGGWHLETAGLVTLPGQEVEVAPALYDGDVALAGDQVADRYALVGWSGDGCQGSFAGIRTYIDDGVAALPPGTDVLREYICPLEGRALRWTVSVTTADGGVTVTDEVEVIAAMDPYDVAICAEVADP